MKTLKDLSLDNKTVILRCDYNVPVKDGIITDVSRIEKSLKTISYLLECNCKIVILSHLGRIKSEEQKKSYSLRIVAQKLSELLNKKIIFVDQCFGKKVKEIVDNAKLKDIIFLENTRFMDYPDKLESSNDANLAKFWASLGDVFVLDAFGTCHREHASVVGIANYLPCGLGFLIEEELKNLDCLVNVKERPFTIFMGGAKVEDKLPLIKLLLPKCDYLLLGGGIANSFLKANGMDVKKSLATSDISLLSDIKCLLANYSAKICLPVDFVYDNEAIMDIGVNTIQSFSDIFYNSKLIFVNGTPGKFEDERFFDGTLQLFKALSEINTKIILGGGDTINAVKKCELSGSFTFESSGGGATLEYIASGELKALKYFK